MTCRSLVHELSHEQPKTTKELLDIATRHASGEEAIEAAFTLANAGTTTDSGRATPDKTTAKCDFKRRTRPPIGHFNKILEAACPHHPYPVKHRLRGCTMMKKIMTTGAPSSSGEPG
jgi:hypothetical protein